MCCLLHRRDKQEDRFSAIPVYNKSKTFQNSHDGDKLEATQAYFGVFDGHSGTEAAQFVEDHLHNVIRKHLAAYEVSI